MTKKKTKGTKKSLPIWVVALICLAAGLVVAGIVFLVLVKVSEADDLNKAKEVVNSISETSESVKKYLYGENEGEKVSEETKNIFAGYEEAVDKIGECMKDLEKGHAVGNGEAKTKFEEASEQLGDLQKVSEIGRLLIDAMDDGALSDEEIEQLANTDSEYLKTMASEYKEFRAKAAEFNEKYADLKGKNKAEFDADAAAVKQLGDELVTKYKEINFDDVYGKSRDDIYKFYATIEELNKILAEKN